MHLNLPTGLYQNGVHGNMQATPNTLAAAGIGRDMIRPDLYASVAYQRTREMTIDELLLENRVVFLIGEINHASAARVIMQMLYLENQKRGQDINFYINSPGGAVDDTLAIYDTMQFISRIILPHAKVMIHQPHGGVYGQTSDIQIQAEMILKMKRQLNEILAKHTGQDVERVAKDAERDKYFSAEEAKAYGLVDDVASFPEKGKR
jgi:ATP-dependent Clp protease protease subunit